MTLFFLLLYLACVLAIGAASRRRAGRDEASYFVADRSLNTFWGFIGLSSLTTGGSTTIALAAFVYEHGLSGLWLDLSGALGLLTLAAFLARRVRREGAVTLPEIVGSYYGTGARTAAGLLVLVSEIVWFALLIEATQIVLTVTVGIAPVPAIVGSTAVFVLYTSLGGQFAVVRTDLLQYALMVAGIPVIALACALTRSGSFSVLPRQVWSFPASPSLPPGAIFALLITVGLPHLVGSDVYAKLLSCRDEATARRSAALAGVSKIVFGLAVAAIALAARACLAPGPPIAALPRAILAFVPAPLAAFVLVCLVATMHSSADSVLLSAAAVTARDLVPAVARRPLPVSASRFLSPLYGTLGLLVALAMKRDVIETLKLGYSLFAAGLILPTLVALTPAGRRLPAPAAIAAMLVGATLTAAGRFVPAIALGRDPVLVGTAANLVVLLAALAASARSAPDNRPA